MATKQYTDVVDTQVLRGVGHGEGAVTIVLDDWLYHVALRVLDGDLKLSHSSLPGVNGEADGNTGKDSSGLHALAGDLDLIGVKSGKHTNIEWTGIYEKIFIK